MGSDPAAPSGDIIPDSVSENDLPVGFASDAEALTGCDPAHMVRFASGTGAAVDILIDRWVEVAPLVGTAFEARVGFGDGVCKGNER